MEHSAPAIEARLAVLEHRLRRQRRLTHTVMAVGVAVMVGAWAYGTPEAGVLRVSELIIEDSLGRPRIVLGAPLALPGRSTSQNGVGIAILSEDGKLRTGLGSPMPAAQIDGTVTPRISDAAGLVIADADGNERGGMGAFADGRATVCLDWAKGVKEAACLVVYPNDQLAGLVVNGTPSQAAFDRVTAIVGADGLALVKIATTAGRESAMLRSTGMGPAELMVYDSVARGWKNVMPRP